MFRARQSGMPLWRYVANRGLTLVENKLLGTKVSEFHTGCRAFSRALLERLPLAANSDDFVFDNQVLAEVVWLGFPIGEVSCPTSYASDASSINFCGSVRYGFGCLGDGGRPQAGQTGPDALTAVPGRSMSARRKPTHKRAAAQVSSRGVPRVAASGAPHCLRLV